MAKNRKRQSTFVSSPPRSGWGWKGILAVVAVLAVVAYFLMRPGTEEETGGGTGLVDGQLEDQDKVFARYAGSDTCRDCHPSAYQSWRQSNHGMAERPPVPAMDADAFEPGRSFEHGTQVTQVRSENGRYLVETLGYGSNQEPYQVERVIGHNPLRQFLVTGPRGRLQTLEASWDPHRKEWFNVYGDEDRVPGEWGHWTGRGMTWNSMCASCHNTRLRKNYDEATDTYHTAMAEMTVSCESCHGPMKDHVDWQHKYPDGGREDPTLKPIDRKTTLSTCGSCHARRYELTGDFKPGDDFDQHYRLTIVDQSDIYYPDGQVLEENYEYASFLSSKMHAAGVTCLDCHHPHLARPLLQGNQLCMRCHSGGYPNSPVINPAKHSFHDVNGPGGQCINCHMPQTTYMQRHPRHDHSFSIPDPLLTKELGIPNACNRCHEDKNVAWTLAAVDRWYGDKMERPSRQRTRSIAAARRGDSAARDPLVAMLSGEETPYWKAVAANVLDPWAADPKVTQALKSMVTHSNALVRANVIHSLASLVQSQQYPEVDSLVRARLEDPVRSVRYQAAWALRRTVNPDSLAGRELRHAMDHNADFPTGQMQKGVYELSRGNLEQARVHYDRAVQWDPNSAPLRHELAVVLSMLGRSGESVPQLEMACRLEPDEAEYRYKLGLALNEIGQLPRALDALREATRLNPQLSRAWYNLGLGLNQTGQSEEALRVLLQGEASNVQDPNLPYARSTILVQLGRYEEAKAAAGRALEIQPGHPAALDLFRRLP